MIKKVGSFYKVNGEDAYLMYGLFQYKIINGKTGFPISACNKVINCLEENQINYQLEEKSKNYKKKNQYERFLKKGKRLWERENRINTLYEKVHV